jgi:hypothetical protein
MECDLNGDLRRHPQRDSRGDSGRVSRRDLQRGPRRDSLTDFGGWVESVFDAS